MATMHHLFFGLILIALCAFVGANNGILTSGYALSLPFAKKSHDKVLLLQELASAVSPSIKVLSDTVLGTFAKTKVSRKRNDILQIASAEIGVREATGNNDGDRVEEYLQYTGLGKGYAWCAAFVSWCFGQAGLPEPHNPWSPALFPNARMYCRSDACRRSSMLMRINPADIFGIYGRSVRRINHVGLVKEVQGKYLITIEGNSNNRVESKRRHLATIYALADWIGDGK